MLEGQESDRDQILKQDKARYNFLKLQTRGSALVAKGKSVKKDSTKILF